MRWPDCLGSPWPLTESDLTELEMIAFAGDSLEHKAMQKLIREFRRLSHELNDPAFMYAGSRIRRDAILCRDAEIDKLIKKPEVTS